MSLNSSSKPWTIKQLLKMMENGSIKFNNLYQRNYVWDRERESNLIASIVEDYPIPPLYCGRKKTESNGKPKNIYDMLNGKQRLTAICKFVKGVYAIRDIREVVIDDECYDINGLFFDDLPEDVKNSVLDRTLTVVYFDDLTKDEERQMIINFNKAKSMTAVELTRVEMKSFESLLRISAHPFFKEALTEAAFKRYINEDCSMKIWAILYMENPSFETKKLRPEMRKAIITKDQEQTVIEVLDRIMAVVKIIKERNKKAAKHIKSKTHMINIAPCIKQSIDANVPLDLMTRWLEYFYSGKRRASISDRYNENTSRSSAQAVAIKIRLEELSKSYTSYIIHRLPIPEVITGTKGKSIAKKAAEGGARETNSLQSDKAKKLETGELETTDLRPDEAKEPETTDVQPGETKEPETGEPETDVQPGETKEPETGEPETTDVQPGETKEPETGEPETTDVQSGETKELETGEPETTDVQPGETKEPETGEPEITDLQSDETEVPGTGETETTYLLLDETQELEVGEIETLNEVTSEKYVETA